MTIEDMLTAQFVLYRYARNKNDKMFEFPRWRIILQDFFNT
jgi:hypothetical protein